MHVLTAEKRCQIVRCLVEGSSIRATCRMTGTAKATVLKFLVDLGAVCEALHDQYVRGVGSKRVQCDEIWAFCYAKDKNLPDSMRGTPGVGSVWTWTGMCADSKLMLSYHVGTRDADCASHFMHDLAGRLAHRVQLTTDGHKAYLEAVDSAFGSLIDYAQLVKLYGAAKDDHRYSPGECIGTRKQYVQGHPDPKHISTSLIERQNLTMRMSMRRFTRLTNAFSKKVANLEAAVALHFFYYNFCRIHQTLRVTPAMAAGLTDHAFEVEELVALLERAERDAIAGGALKRGKYGPRTKTA
jgi:IS1 family transposase